jgi:tape measure domain-containing protein
MSNGEEVAFGLDLEGDMAIVAKKMAAEMSRLEAQIQAVGKATTKTERKFASSKWFDGDNMRRHASYLERSRKSYRDLAPASAAAARGLRAFGISGSWVRKFSIDAAKSEIALRRLYSVKGGGARGAAAVAGSLTRRGVSRYGAQAAAGIGSAAMGATKVAGGASLAIGGAAAVGAGMLGANMMGTAIEAEQLRFALDRVTSGQGLAWWGKASDYAETFGMNVNTVAKNLMDMKASGFDDGTVDTLFKRMGDLRAMGANEETIGRAMLAIRQVAAAGRLQGDELNQLGEAGINASIIYEVLGKKLGKTTAEIVKMKEAGKLTSDMVIPAIGEAIGVKTGGGAAGEAGAAAANSTLAGLWGKMQGSWSVASANSLQGGQFDPIKRGVESFTAWITGPGGEKAIGGFANVMGRIFEAVPVIVENVIWFFDEALPAAFSTFSVAWESSGGAAALERILGSTGELGGESGEGAISWAQRFGESAGNLAGAVVSLVDAAKPLLWILTKIVGLGMMVPNVIGSVTGFFSNSPGLQPADSVANDNGAGSANDNSGFYSAGQNLGQGLASGMYASSSDVWNAGAYLAQTAEDAARAQSETHSPSRAWERLGQDETDGYLKGKSAAIPEIQSTSAKIAQTSLVSAGNPNASVSAPAMPSVTVHVSIDRGQGEGRSDRELMEMAGDVFERRLTRVFARAGGM